MVVNMLTDSLKRLYTKEKLSKKQIVERVTKGSITAEEYAYITGEAYEV